MPLTIDTAGLHPTTDICLGLLQKLQERADFANILEIGCGNGILSLAAAHIWDARVTAGDIAPKAVADTLAKIEEYGLSGRITAVRSDGFSHPAIAERAPYDLIICNLLADVILGMAHDLKKHMAKGGYVLLSGILAWRGEEVERIFQGIGMDIIDKTMTSPWNSYIFRGL